MDTRQPRSQCLAFVLVVACFGLTSPCHAARVIDSDTVYDETCPLENTQCGEPLVVIDGETPPTVLKFVEPGWISLYDSPSSEPVVWASDASVVDVSGGSINPGLGPGVQASDSATVRIVDGLIGGYLEGVLAEDQSHVEVAGGTIVSANTDALMLRDSATANIAGGTFTSEESYDVRTQDNTVAAISGGRFSFGEMAPRSVSVGGGSQVHITGGEFRGIIHVQDTGVLTVDDGTFSEVLESSNTAATTVYGGSFSGERGVFLSANDSATLDLYGGSFMRSGAPLVETGWLTAEAPAAINVFGRDLQLSGERLTGTLSDGTAIDVVAKGNIVLHEIEAVLQAGDANQNLIFDQHDIVQVLAAGRYLTGQLATWGEGDWDGAPGGIPGNPTTGDGQFNQLDIVAALQSSVYLTGPYAAVLGGGEPGDEQTSIVYDANTGKVSIDAPAGVALTSMNIDSAGGIFTGQPAQNLGGSFDNANATNIFKATFGGSFGSISFGRVAQVGLTEAFVAGDLTVVGSLEGGGPLGEVDLVYVPEPSNVVLLVLGIVALAIRGKGPPSKRRLRTCVER